MSLKTLVGIIDYGMGNIKSVEKALSFIGVESKIVDNSIALQDCTHIILPGVGSFGEAVKNLKDKGLFEALQQNKKPLLGICLGMQLLAESSEESPGVSGLGLIKGRVSKLKSEKLPHIGWDDGYYYVHSYGLNADDTGFTKMYFDNNIWAVQFHPEKSQEKGLGLLKE